MKKVYRKLTKDQKSRGVIFSSVFLGVDSYCIHEVFVSDDDMEEKIKRLKNDKFFRGWGEDKNGNIIHEIRS